LWGRYPNLDAVPTRLLGDYSTYLVTRKPELYYSRPNLFGGPID